tara:strand:- start:2040 stop:3296 length:1257 start_codon:yes stop_codon:yes gene_type:complete
MSRSDKDVLIVGGGVIGLCSAWYLSEAGYQVTIIDRDVDRTESCSEENAGMIVPSHFIPLAAPGVISQGLKWMLNPSSPFYLRPRLDPRLWAWCWQFARHSNAKHVEGSCELLRDLSLESRRLFLKLTDELGVEFVTRGLMMLCQSEEGLKHEVKVAEAANALGVDAEVCDRDRVHELDPGAQMNVIGGVWFRQDCHLHPGRFLEALRKGISNLGGKFVDGEAVDFVCEGSRVKAVVTATGHEIEADSVVLAGGAWTPEVAAKLSLKLPMQGGKGYSLMLSNPPELPELCSLLKEARVAVTPMGDQLRVAGTMEICGKDLSVNRKRLQGIIDSFCRFFPAFEPENFEGIRPWSGLRPCSPDGLPYLGRVPGIENAIVATGHSMLGLSLGPITGRLVTEIVSGNATSIDTGQMEPGRFS